MADAKSSLTNSVSPLVAGVTGAALGHFAGKGKNLILGAALVLGADFIAAKLPAAITASSIRTAGTVALLVNPAAASAGNQSLADFAKDGVNRLKGFANTTVMGAGLAKGPFALNSGTVIDVPVSGIDYIGESPYQIEAARYYNQPQAMLAPVRSTAGR